MAQGQELDERTKLVFQQARAGVSSNKAIMEGLYTANNFNGLKASQDWQKMNNHERVARMFDTEKYLFTGTGIVSLYHLTRFNSLSSSGRILAPAGAVFSLFAVYSSISS